MDVIIFNEERGWNIRKAKLYRALKDWGQDITGLLQKKLIYYYPIKVGFFERPYCV